MGFHGDRLWNLQSRQCSCLEQVLVMLIHRALLIESRDAGSRSSQNYQEFVFSSFRRLLGFAKTGLACPLSRATPGPGCDVTPRLRPGCDVTLWLHPGCDVTRWLRHGGNLSAAAPHVTVRRPRVTRLRDGSQRDNATAPAVEWPSQRHRHHEYFEYPEILSHVDLVS